MQRTAIYMARLVSWLVCLVGLTAAADPADELSQLRSLVLEQASNARAYRTEAVEAEEAYRRIVPTLRQEHKSQPQFEAAVKRAKEEWKSSWQFTVLLRLVSS